MIELESQITHQLGQTGAIKRVREFVGSLPQRFPQQVHQVTMRVRDDSVEVRFAAYGFVVQWRAEIQESCVILHGSIPESARKFQNKMLQTVADRIEQALQPVATMRRAA